MRLLIADDESAIRKGLLSLSWESIGIDQVEEAENGIQAREILKNKKVDIVISDIRMPGLSGLELAEYVKEYALDTAVILLTGFSEFEYAQRAIRNQVFEYLLKPVRPKDILNTVSQVQERLKRKRYKEQVVRKYETAANSLDFGEQISCHFSGCNKQTMDILLNLAQNFSQAVSLNLLAEQYHFSVGYLSRMIKKETGYSFSEILNSIRLGASIELLRDEKIKTGLVAESVGFSDQKYFSQVFKRVFGASPIEFRRQKQEQNYTIREILEMSGKIKED